MSNCSVTFDDKVPCVVMAWNGYATSQQFRAANEDVLAIIEARRASKLLGDITHFKLIGADDQRWLNDMFIPRMIAAGLRHVALVQPIYYFNKVAVDTVSQRVDQSRLLIGHFDNQTEARAWLSQQQ
jgi:hypothetical protein